MKVSKSLIFFDVDTVSFNLADLNQLHILSSEESLWRWLALEEGLMMARDSILGLSPNPNSFFTPFPRQYWYFQPKARIKKTVKIIITKTENDFEKAKGKQQFFLFSLIFFILVLFTHLDHPSGHQGIISPRQRQRWTGELITRTFVSTAKEKQNAHRVNVWLSGF